MFGLAPEVPRASRIAARSEQREGYGWLWLSLAGRRFEMVLRLGFKGSGFKIRV